jgi:hypothetical protein
MDSVWEQEKLETTLREMFEKLHARSAVPQRPVCFVWH